MKLSFYGGTREVTGSCFLLETAETKVLIDCGMFQGSRECEELNYESFKFNPAEIDVLIATHAHLDHIGRIPKLVHDGFRGKIYSTAPTKDLARLILEDALHLREKGEQRLLYTEEDLDTAFSLWQEFPYRRQMAVADAKIEFYNAGHILGSVIVRIEAEGKKLLFSGDLGNNPSVILPPTENFHDVEYLVIESTYGNRTHETESERVLKLERAVEDIAARGGTLMIPAFATERVQDILHLLNEMLHFKRIPDIPVFVDAPLATRITEVFEKYPEYYRDEIKALHREHPNLFRFKKLKFTLSAEESKAINNIPAPKVIIAGSGMMTGGRILHHATRYLPDPKSMLLIIGYQVPGSLGRRLLDKEKSVRIYGNEVRVEAEIRKINGFSAHADNPQLFAFIESNRDALKTVFMIHGEEASALHLAQEVKDKLGVPAEAPMLYQSFMI